MLLDHSAGSPGAVVRGAGPSRCPEGGLSQRIFQETCTAGECLKAFHAVIRACDGFQRSQTGSAAVHGAARQAAEAAVAALRSPDTPTRGKAFILSSLQVAKLRAPGPATLLLSAALPPIVTSRVRARCIVRCNKPGGAVAAPLLLPLRGRRRRRRQTLLTPSPAPPSLQQLLRA